MPSQPDSPAQLSLSGALRLNMLDMIGVGPFITLPLVLSLLPGHTAIWAWLLAAVLALCDGMVWAELGASFPQAGGSYQYLKHIYGPQGLGRLLAFLFAWQVLFSAPLSLASGGIGFAGYAGYLWPALHRGGWQGRFLGIAWRFNPGTLVAMGVVLLALFLLFRNIRGIEKLARWLWLGVMLALGMMILAGLAHALGWHPLALAAAPAPPPAIHMDKWAALASALLIATYDYWGYYNICFLAGELRQPERTLPRAVLGSIAIVAGLYILLNFGILSVIPAAWFLAPAAHPGTHQAVAAVFMRLLLGSWGGRLAALLIMWTAFGSIFSLLLGYSRVPWAAARDGNFFRLFAPPGETHGFPARSLLVLAAAGMLGCLFSLTEVIAALVVVRLLLQFLLQAAGLLWLRRRQPQTPRPFRMWLYPAPAWLAIAGFIYMLLARPDFGRALGGAAIILGLGLALYAWRQRLSPAPPPAASS